MAQRQGVICSFLQPGRMILSPEPTFNKGHNNWGMQQSGRNSQLPHHTWGATLNLRPEKRELQLGNNGAFITPELAAPCDPAQVSPSLYMRQSPSVPVVSATFPKQKPSQLVESLGQLPLPRAWGKQGEHQLPPHCRCLHHRWDVAGAGPSCLQLWGVAPWNKKHMEESCILKYVRTRAAPCGV